MSTVSGINSGKAAEMAEMHNLCVVFHLVPISCICIQAS